MRIESHARRIGRVERRDAPKAPSWMEELYAMDREERAVRAVTKFAQELAGFPPPPPPVQVETFRIEALPPPPPVHRPRWTKDIRPGPHDVLTWDEVLQVPWMEEMNEQR